MKFLWLAPFVCFLLGYVSLSVLHNNKSLKAPCLVGIPLDQAVSMASQANLNLRIVGHRHDLQLPENTVLHQTPAAATPIKENQTLYLTLSQKPEPTKIPHFAGLSLSQAKAHYQTALFSMVPIFCTSSKPHGQIIAQCPPADALWDKKVVLYVADSHSKPVLMPNLKNKTIEQIQSFLSLNALSPQILHIHPVAENHTCSSCIITDQRPLPGSLLMLKEDKPLAIQLQVYCPR